MSPTFLPIAPVRVPLPPSGEHFPHELKWDGFRGVAVVGQDETAIFSKTQRYFTTANSSSALLMVAPEPSSAAVNRRPRGVIRPSTPPKKIACAADALRYLLDRAEGRGTVH